MPKLHLKPVTPELIVRDPVTMLPLPAEGKFVEITSFWMRRLKVGDVVEVQMDVDPPSPSAESQTELDDSEGD